MPACRDADSLVSQGFWNATGRRSQCFKGMTALWANRQGLTHTGRVKTALQAGCVHQRTVAAERREASEYRHLPKAH